MSVNLKDKYVSAFVSNEEIYSYQDKITKAHNDLHGKTGAGNDFTGWVDLPVDYDKEEFERIKVAAEKIKKTRKKRKPKLFIIHIPRGILVSFFPGFFF